MADEHERGPDDEPAEGAGPDGTGVDAVRAALNRARAAAAARGHTPSSRPGPAAGRGRRRVAGQSRSGAHPDGRDPQRVAGVIDRLVAERGWQAPVAVGGVIGRWEQVVGDQVATHCTAEAFADGVLTVRADSTAWATQLRLLTPTLLRRISEELGPGVVERLVVRGPTAPSWHRGPRTVQGRGPRDTYG
ncbi:DUF721 domain-containing protein [Quadrisphaera sp. GCM10027208]|uniref:DUF721 domain-containing protein n=1 Tax=Quadrisphaera sp. GCM10027208 TaxID=3273423 RepID=UPI003613B238